MAGSKYKLGVGLTGNLLVLAMLLAAAGYLLNAAQTAELGPLVIGGNQLGGPEVTHIMIVAVAGLFGGGALFLLIKILRNFGNEEYVLIDPNRMVVSGQSLDGGERTISHAEIVRIIEHTFRGMPALEIHLRDGSKLGFGAVQFGSSAKYQAFRAELQAFAPGSMHS